MNRSHEARMSQKAMPLLIRVPMRFAQYSVLGEGNHEMCCPTTHRVEPGIIGPNSVVLGRQKTSTQDALPFLQVFGASRAIKSHHLWLMTSPTTDPPRGIQGLSSGAYRRGGRGLVGFDLDSS
jgi:hypothetical protein